MKTKAEIILELVISLNKGNSGYINDRVAYAIDQYYQLVRHDVIKEEEEE